MYLFLQQPTHPAAPLATVAADIYLRETGTSAIPAPRAWNWHPLLYMINFNQTTLCGAGARIVRTDTMPISVPKDSPQRES